jgi:hypothetical protein
LQTAVALVPCPATRTALTTIGTMVHGVDANLLKLMSHLGVTPVQRSRMGLMFLGSHLDSVNGLSSATTHTATPKPKCPWCQSSNFICEKNLVQHLASAIRKIGVPPSKTSSCRFSAVLHSEVMGKASGIGTDFEAAAFMWGLRKCFVTGEVVGFDPHRCAVAAVYSVLWASCRINFMLLGLDFVCCCCSCDDDVDAFGMMMMLICCCCCWWCCFC